jgi:hypothetical protein
MLMVNKHDLDPKLNIMGLKRGDKVELEIADVSPMGFTLDPKTLKLNEVRDLNEVREPLVKASKPKNTANMPLPALKNMIQKPMPAPMAPPAVAPAPVMPPPMVK